jgi:hypothetical protein
VVLAFGALAALLVSAAAGAAFAGIRHASRTEEKPASQQVVYLYHRRLARGEEFGVFESHDDAKAAAAGKHGYLVEVISCTVIPAGSRHKGHRRARRPADWMAKQVKP